MAARAFVRRNPGVQYRNPAPSFIKNGSRPGTPNPVGGPGLWAPLPSPKIKVAPPAIILSQSNINHMYTMTVANSGKEQFFYGVGVRTRSCLYSFRTS
jgi:hypothetical protein